VGTCRWADIYFQFNVENVIGLDASQDMLNRSRDILIDRGITNFDLKKVDLINGREIQLSSQPELVACTRFLNWLNFSQVQKTFSILSSLKSSYILIGVSVYDNKRSVFSKTSAILSHYFEDSKRLFSSLAPIYVHNKKNIEMLFSQYQWEILSCNPIFEDRIRMNFFYLLKRNNKI